RRPRAGRVDRRLGAAPMSGGELHAQARTAIPARFAEAFGDWTPQAVVFDCDGLLLDTESVWQTAEDRVVAAHDAVLRERAAALSARGGGHDEQVVRADLHRACDRELAGGIRTLPGAAEILQLPGAKVPLGCASNSWLDSLEDKLRLGGLREHFTVLEASDTV